MKSAFGLLLLFCLSFIFFACISLDPLRFDSPYYYEGSFHNLNPDAPAAKSFGDVIKWKLFSEEDPPAVEGLPEDPPEGYLLEPDDLLAPRNKIRIVWLGHATVWIAANYEGRRTHLITDPLLGEPFLLPKRLVELPLAPEAFPPVDAVLVSHAHRDHLDIDSLQLLQKHNPEVVIYLPDGSRELARDNGLIGAKVIEWWQQEQAGLFRINFAPSQHWSRLGINDAMQIHWGSYILNLKGARLYFAGDTGYSPHFREIGARWPSGFDIALLPIGAFKPRWFMSTMHINPPEALLAAKDLGARMLLPIHWGAFSLGDDKPQEAILYLKHLLKESDQKALLWQPGSHLDLPLPIVASTATPSAVSSGVQRAPQIEPKSPRQPNLYSSVNQAL